VNWTKCKTASGIVEPISKICFYDPLYAITDRSFGIKPMNPYDLTDIVRAMSSTVFNVHRFRLSTLFTK